MGRGNEGAVKGGHELGDEDLGEDEPEAGWAGFAEEDEGFCGGGCRGGAVAAEEGGAFGEGVCVAVVGFDVVVVVVEVVVGCEDAFFIVYKTTYTRVCVRVWTGLDLRPLSSHLEMILRCYKFIKFLSLT